MENFEAMLIRFDRICERDGWTDSAWRHRPRLCITSLRNKKSRLILLRNLSDMHWQYFVYLASSAGAAVGWQTPQSELAWRWTVLCGQWHQPHYRLLFCIHLSQLAYFMNYPSPVWGTGAVVMAQSVSWSDGVNDDLDQASVSLGLVLQMFVVFTVV